MARRHIIPRRTPVLLGCEGPSEEGYARWLNQLAARSGILIHIQTVTLHGGSVLRTVRTFVKTQTNHRRKGSPYKHFAILLDRDQQHDSVEDLHGAGKLAAQGDIAMIWQEPCHEAFLLRHFDGFQGHRPVDKAQAERQLAGVWRQYNKGMTAMGYDAVLSLDHLWRVRLVEQEFDAFMTAIGWPR